MRTLVKKLAKQYEGIEIMEFRGIGIPSLVRAYASGNCDNCQTNCGCLTGCNSNQSSYKTTSNSSSSGDVYLSL